MSAAQIIFSLALGAVTLIVVAFALYVVSTAARGDRWARHRGGGAVNERREGR